MGNTIGIAEKEIMKYLAQFNRYKNSRGFEFAGLVGPFADLNHILGWAKERNIITEKGDHNAPVVFLSDSPNSDTVSRYTFPIISDPMITFEQALAVLNKPE